LTISNKVNAGSTLVKPWQNAQHIILGLGGGGFNPFSGIVREKF
jgi:hypothetical protein